MRMKRIAVTALAAVTVSATIAGVAGPAAAQSSEDVQQLLENAPAAAETLANGAQATAQTLVDTQSAVAVGGALGQTLVDTGTVLVADTQQFGALGLGLLLINTGVQQVTAPYLGAVDDPATAPDIVDPAAAEFLAAGLPAFLEAEQATLERGLVHALQGNLIDPPLGIGPAFYSEAVVGTLMNAFAWTGGNEPDGPYTTPLESVVATLGITSIVAGAAVEPQVTEVEGAIAPAIDAAAPVTDQLISVIEGL